MFFVFDFLSHSFFFFFSFCISPATNSTEKALGIADEATARWSGPVGSTSDGAVSGLRGQLFFFVFVFVSSFVVWSFEGEEEKNRESDTVVVVVVQCSVFFFRRSVFFFLSPSYLSFPRFSAQLFPQHASRASPTHMYGACSTARAARMRSSAALSATRDSTVTTLLAAAPSAVTPPFDEIDGGLGTPPGTGAIGGGSAARSSTNVVTFGSVMGGGWR